MPLSLPPLSCWSPHHSIPSCFSEMYLPVIISGPQEIALRNLSTCRLLLVNQKPSLYLTVTHRTLVKVSTGCPECLQRTPLETKAIKSQETLTDTPNQRSLFSNPKPGPGPLYPNFYIQKVIATVFYCDDASFRDDKGLKDRVTIVYYCCY